MSLFYFAESLTVEPGGVEEFLQTPTLNSPPQCKTMYQDFLEEMCNSQEEPGWSVSKSTVAFSMFVAVKVMTW